MEHAAVCGDRRNVDQAGRPTGEAAISGLRLRRHELHLGHFLVVLGLRRGGETGGKDSQRDASRRDRTGEPVEMVDERP